MSRDEVVGVAVLLLAAWALVALLTWTLGPAFGGLLAVLVMALIVEWIG